ncbi:MAG TPA: phage major capsid protein [Thermoguttaceae bacterium]|nr:phage major capsid protein [Thermoguttaceae bacterium]
MTIAELMKKYPELLKGNPDAVEAKRRVKALVAIDGVTLTDADGADIDIEVVELVTMASEEPEPEAESADKDANLEKAVKDAVAKAMKANPPRAPFERPEPEPATFVIPAQSKRYRATNFRQRNLTSVSPDPELAAYKFGAWFAGICGVPWATKRCKELGIPLHRDKALSEGVNTAGGFLVPEDFEPTIIELMEQYGVFRKYASIEPMSGDTKTIPRRTGGLTAYFVGENSSGTQSDPAWDQVNLVARKLMTLTKTSTELGEDAVINIGDKIANEAAYAFAYKEDLCGFLGDGSQTYGGIVGVGPRLTNLFGVSDDDDGVIVGTGDTIAEITMSDLNKVMGLLPLYADTPNCAWYCHRRFFSGGMQRLMEAYTGNNIVDLENGSRVLKFLGYPVRLTQVMNTGTAVSQVLAIFGDLALAAKFGDRRGFTLATSDSALNAFEQDEIVIRATQRFDIVVHDVGTTTSAGPVVALLGKAS